MSWKRRKFVKTTSALAGASCCGLIPLAGCTSIKYISGEVNNNTIAISKLEWGEAEFVLVSNTGLSTPIFVKNTEQGYSAVLER